MAELARNRRFCASKTSKGGMGFCIADTFTDSLAKLTGDEQAAATTTALDL